ncbi:MAG: hypothetical protein Q4D02_07815 [Clostridia bacterium]|nr:hypothetical protein [Clostridia bacterium]
MERKEKIKIFFVFLLLSFLLGGIFYAVKYSSDAYEIVGWGIENYNQFAWGNMRPLQYLITKAFIFVLGSDVQYEVIYTIYLTLALILLAFSMYFVYVYMIKLIDENEKIEKLTKWKKLLMLICVSFMFFNRYLSDNLIYLENLTMILALFLAVVASILYSKNIKFKNIICLVLLVISEFSYQTMITAFVVLSLLFYTLKNSKKIELKYLIKLSVLFVIPLICLYGFSKIEFNNIEINDRYAASDEIIYVILGVILQVLIYFIKYILYYFVVGIIFHFTNIDKENKYVNYNLILILFISVAYSYSFGLINKACLSNRMAWSIGALFSIICLFVIVFKHDIEMKRKKYGIAIGCICLLELTLFYSLYGVYIIYNNKVETNAQYVISYVDKWEKENDKKIESIAFYQDEEITKSEWFSIVPYLTMTIYNVEDDFYTQLKIVSNNRFLYLESSDEVFNEYFKGQDWKELDDGQFVVIDNTLHMCKF